MEQTTERRDSAATAEKLYPSIEETLDMHPGYKVVGNFAASSYRDGAVMNNIQALLVRRWKSREPALGTYCTDENGETRYIVIAPAEEPGIENVIGGVALGMPPPHRY